MEHYDNVKDFLNQNKFNNYDAIHIIWKTFGDDNIIEVINNDYSMYNRFHREIVTNTCFDYQSKVILRGGIDLQGNTTGGAHLPCLGVELKDV